ncbi:MAG: hypothetical protein ACI4OO_11125 [Otoolea sp.]|nr:hypothetical protein [Clostridiaceae bacterium]
MKRRAACAVPVILGILFCFYYIYRAADNVAYTDYIRLINSYLPDVANPAKFFVADVLTRVPVTYLARIINVALFGYNTMFDMALGVLGLGIGGAVLAVYAGEKKEIGFGWFLLIQFVYFGLNKWEMLTNGTGWVCFLAVSGFILHFAVLDHTVRYGCRGRWERILLIGLAPVLTLLIAGTYCGSYSAIMLLALGTILLVGNQRDRRERKTYQAAFASVLISLLLYLWSSSQAVYVHRGAVAEGSIVSEFFRNPLFFVRFLLKAFASAVIGVAQLEGLGNRGDFFGTDAFVYLLGGAVIFLYLYALYLTWRYRIYEETILPLLLILSGGLNHLLILAARWIFLKEEYGMSSRYGLQYQLGLLGILFTFALVMEKRKESGRDGRHRRKKGWKPVGSRVLHRVPDVTVLCIAAGTILLAAGSGWTTMKELQTAPYRKEYLQISREMGLHYRTASDEDLETYLHSSAEDVRAAMKILEDNHLNIFR